MRMINREKGNGREKSEMRNKEKLSTAMTVLTSIVSSPPT